MTQAPPAILYDRLGGAEGLRAIVNDIVDAHYNNPVLAPRFRYVDLETGKQHAFEFFAAAAGGPQTYSGQPLPEAHKGMNVNEAEFVATCDDALAVLNAHGVGEREQQEVLGLFFALKDQVMHL